MVWTITTTPLLVLLQLVLLLLLGGGGDGSGWSVAVEASTTTTTSFNNNNYKIQTRRSNRRLPQSLVSVLTALEKDATEMLQTTVRQEKEEQDQEEEEEPQDVSLSDDATSTKTTTISNILSISAACFLSSQTLTRQEQQHVCHVLLGNNKSMGEKEDKDNNKEEEEEEEMDFDHVKAAGFCVTTMTNHNNDKAPQQQQQQQWIGCLAFPTSLAELSSCLLSTRGQIVYVPSSMDLLRGEGLMTLLAPALQQILQLDTSTTSTTTSSLLTRTAKLMIVILDPTTMKLAQEQVAKALEMTLSTLIVDRPSSVSSSYLVVSKEEEEEEHDGTDAAVFPKKRTTTTPLTIGDIFGGGIEFVTLDQAAQSLWGGGRGQAGTEALSSSTTTNNNNMNNKKPLTDLSLLTQAAAGLSTTRTLTTTTTTSSSWTPREWAAARVLMEPAQRIVDNCLETVQQARTIVVRDDGNTVTTKTLIPAFGELCTTTLDSAATELNHLTTTLTTATTATAARAICSQAMESLTWQLQEEVLDQLQLQHVQSFRDLETRLSKILLGPQLARDLNTVAHQVQKEFSHAAQRLSFGNKNNNGGGTTPTTLLLPNNVVTLAISEFQRTVQDRIKKALLNAQATGKFRPLPRKGVTVGLHWLLPKPFGNDYRQEPWMVHATDNLVYLPSSSSPSSTTTKRGVVMEVDPSSVLSSTATTVDDSYQNNNDWRSQIVPNPAGNELIYSQQ